MSPAATPKKKTGNLNRIFLIIAAAGIGSRMESDINKQIMEIDGVTVIERTLNAFKEFNEGLGSAGVTLRAVIVTSEDLVYKVNGIVRYGKYDFVQKVISGGSTRTESVWRGIEAIADLPFPPNDNDIVFIHDGARCLVDQPTLERCLEGAIQYDICAAAVPVKNTIKQTVHKEEPKPSEPEPVAGGPETEEAPEEPVKAEEPKIEVPKEEPKPEPKKSSVLGIDLSKYPTLSGRLSLGKKTEPEVKEVKEEPKPEPKEEPKKETPAPGPKVKLGTRFDREPKALRPIINDDAIDARAMRSAYNVRTSPRKQEVKAEPQVIKEKEASSEASSSPFVPKKASSEPVARASGGKPIFKAVANEVTNAPEVLTTPNRKDLMEVQTPQVFKFDKLVKSYINGIQKNIEATDDTSLAEAINLKVHLVEGSYTNIKITTREDIAYAETILRQKAQGGAQ